MTEYLSIAIIILMLCTSGAFLLHWKIKQIRLSQIRKCNRQECDWADQIVEDVE